MVDAAAAVDTAALCAEVGLVVSRVRSGRELEALDLPCLDRVASVVGQSREGLLTESIPLVPDELYRRFLELLLPFPLPERGRWPALGRRHISDEDTGRGVAAGYEVFGISSWDGLNARTDELGGRSRREIAEEMLAVAIADREVLGRAPTPRSSTSRPRWRLGAAALVAILVLGGAAFAVMSSADDDPPIARPDESTSATCRPLAEVGSVTGPWTEATASAAIEAAGEAARAEGATLCPIGEVTSWGELVVQEIAELGWTGPGALIGVPDGSSVHLPPAIYTGYHQIGGKDGSVAQDSAGFPLEVRRMPDGHIEVTFSKGVVLIGESLEAPFFWIPALFVDWWRAHPELGLPTGNPMATLTQHFQHGRVRLDLSSGGGVPVAEVITAREDALPEQRRGRILREPDATGWWIDEDDHRHWIPDVETWVCLGGDEVVAGSSVPGWAIAALPLGDHATCG